MAVRLDASGDMLSRANLAGAQTVMGWFYISVDRNAYSALISINNNNTVALSSDGVTLIHWDGAEEPSGTTLSTATWYHVAISLSNTTVGSSFVVYLNGVADLTEGISSAPSGSTMYIGNDASAEWLNGRVAHVKMWDAQLTAAEVIQEMRVARPVRLANLYLWTPLYGSGDVNDYSGNGRNWTAGGTLTTEDGPPVGYGAPVLYLPSVPAAGGTTYEQSAAGTLTTAGALVRQAQIVRTGALTTAGALIRQTGKIAAGALTSAGALARETAKVTSGALTPSGALAAIKIALLSVSGTLTSAGALVNQAGKVTSGALTTAGSLIKTTASSMAGTLTTAGSLASIRAALISMSGTLTTAGALTRQTATTMAGTLTSAGALIRQTATAMTGALTSSGAFAGVRAALISMGGTLTTAGALTRQTSALFAGTLTTAGGLARQIGKLLTGVLTSAGALATQIGGPVSRYVQLVLGARPSLTVGARSTLRVKKRPPLEVD